MEGIAPKCVAWLFANGLLTSGPYFDIIIRAYENDLRIKLNQ